MWRITCTNPSCGERTRATNIVDLIQNHRDPQGWLLCECGRHGYVEKSYQLQEACEPWVPLLKGVIPLGDADDTYQPFVFLVAHAPGGPADHLWFSYYKDLRPGGMLKYGNGPGGSPILAVGTVAELIPRLVSLGCADSST
jgi:hypothetical protein